MGMISGDEEEGGVGRGHGGGGGPLCTSIAAVNNTAFRIYKHATRGVSIRILITLTK